MRRTGAMYMGSNRDWDEMTDFDRKCPVLSGILYGGAVGLMLGVLVALATFM